MPSWRSALSTPLHYNKPRPGGELRTLADARAYILDLPDMIQRWPQFQGAAQLLLGAAGGERTIADATLQMRLALQAHGALKEKSPPPASRRRAKA